MSNKKQYFFSPKGTVEPYAYLNRPDYGNENFKQPRGVYKLSLTVPSSEAQAMIDRIVKVQEENYAAIVEAWENGGKEAAKAKLKRGARLLEPYEGELPFFENEDGTVTFKFSSYASYQKDEETIPLVLKVVDSKGKRIENVPNISGGSEGKARFSMFAYGFTAIAGASVKLQLDSFMLTKLVEFAGGDNGWGDEAEEDGYVASEAPEAKGSPKSDFDGQEEEGGYEGQAGDDF